jgi:hypothetical protein
MVSIFPTIPSCRYNSFSVEDVNHTHVRFQKNGFANVYVPAERIAAVLETGSHEQPSVQLEGRLQWITARQNWYFRPENPPSPDPWGIGLGRQRVIGEDTLQHQGFKPFPFVPSTTGILR